MTMFNRALKIILENENVTLLECVEEIKDSGASSIRWENKGKLLCNIQRYKEKTGHFLENTPQGDVLTADYMLRCRKQIKDGLRIERQDGEIFEIRNCSRNGINTPLEHYQAKLVRVM